MDIYNIKQKGVETVDEFIARGGKITYLKGNKTNNYCPYCECWNSIKRYYHMKYHYYLDEVVSTPVFKYSRCQCCHTIIKDYTKGDKDDK